MKKRKYFLLSLSITTLFLLSYFESKAQTRVLENFESYSTNMDLTEHWRVFGDVSANIEIVTDTTIKVAPGGNNYLKYTYNSNESGVGGVERATEDNNFFPLNLTTAKAGIQFYLKGDGTNNKIRLSFKNQVDTLFATWKSNQISLKDSEWHIIYIPLKLDVNDNYGMHLSDGNGLFIQSEEDLIAGLGVITQFQLQLDNPDTNDTQDHQIFIDDIRSVDFIPPVGVNVIKIADFEEYKLSADFQEKWQGFGYGTLDYELARNNSAPEGYKYAQWIFQLEERTTWGVAFRNRQVLYKLPNLSTVSQDGGIQFLLKGDGSKDLFLFRFMDTEINYWGSNWISLEDTSWQLVTIPMKASATNGFRWLGNSPDYTCWDCEVGTDEQLLSSMGKLIEMRVDKRFFTTPIPPFITESYPPYLDTLMRSICIDGIYAVDKFPALVPRNADDFETYSDSENLKTAWNQFGTGSVDLILSDITKSGSKSMAIKYNGSAGYTAVRKRNIIPGLDFSSLKAGMQFWLKGDGSNNSITLRLMSGNEMWESAPFSLNNDEWTHVGVKFDADSIEGFRYLGNNPDVPLWSSNIGTKEQLYGDLANIDQLRFYIRDPEASNIEYTIVIDKLEGVDEFSQNIILTDIENEIVNNLPFSYELLQNYPNPFNPATKIRFSLKNPEFVSLKIYNMLGQEIMTLLNEPKKAGQYTVDFIGANLASGVYVYQLSAGSFISAKKMMLIK